MFRLRSVHLDDIDDLFCLSKLSHLINLPSDRELIRKKVAISERSFSNSDQDLSKNIYCFVLEDMDKGVVVGVSTINGKRGTKEEPHMYFREGEVTKYSTTLEREIVHKTLEFDQCTDGWSEIGGLILDPAYRGYVGKLGKQISFVRFLYIAMNRRFFTDEIHTELLPPLENNRPPLWEDVGRLFVDMEYTEADKLSRANKEFVLNLYPDTPIYQSMLKPATRVSIGKVGEESKPALRMLERIGFEYAGEIDPFDGGPHYRCKTDRIKPIKSLQQVTCQLAKGEEKGEKVDLLLSIDSEDYHFEAVHVSTVISQKKIFLDNKIFANFNVKEGQKLYAIKL